MADKAILFGINTYKSIAGLRGCLNDVEDLQRLLVETHGFKPFDVRVYSNQQATRMLSKKGLIGWCREVRLVIDLYFISRAMAPIPLAEECRQEYRRIDLSLRYELGR